MDQKITIVVPVGSAVTVTVEPANAEARITPELLAAHELRMRNSPLLKRRPVTDATTSANVTGP